MVLVDVDPADPTPIYAQLERGLRAAIATGRLRAGDQLPTVRQLAVDLRVNANTVARVYAELERCGVLLTRRGVGSFVAAGRTAAQPCTKKRAGFASSSLKKLNSFYGPVRELRAESATRNLPIIMLTGRARLDAMINGGIAGATVYLTKPVPPDNLVRLMKWSSAARERVG